jgi:hypothetical protein
MNSNVAGCAVSITGIGHVVGGGLGCDAIALSTKAGGAIVALQTDGKNHRSLQKTRIHGPMRRMTNLTPVHTRGSVLEKEGAALVDMTLQTRLFVLQPVLNHVGAACHFPC